MLFTSAHTNWFGLDGLWENKSMWWAYIGQAVIRLSSDRYTIDAPNFMVASTCQLMLQACALYMKYIVKTQEYPGAVFVNNSILVRVLTDSLGYTPQVQLP